METIEENVKYAEHMKDLAYISFVCMIIISVLGISSNNSYVYYIFSDICEMLVIACLYFSATWYKTAYKLSIKNEE